VNKITSFKGYYSFLSNFYPAAVIYDNITYSSVEHAYQAAKTLDLEYRDLICRAATPAKAKRIGKVVPIRDNWELIKVPIMRALVWQKFEDTTLRNQLINTYPAILEEGNYWGDTFWGVDLQGNGENWLGKILMEVRNVKKTNI
jgi:ribA/ribD-fused uncharacterized protein